MMFAEVYFRAVTAGCDSGGSSAKVLRADERFQEAQRRD